MSLFGSSTFGSNTPNNQQSNPLFGSLNTTQPQQQSTSLFGSTTSTSQPQQTGSSLFGSNTASQPQLGGGQFGSSNASQPQQSGGLFGSATNNASQGAQSGSSLFGASKSGGAGLFGGSTANPQHQPQQSSGLFGSTLGQQQQQQQSQNQTQNTGSLFGNAGTQNKPSGLFGNTVSGSQTNMQQQRPSLFSATSSSQVPFAGSLTMGQGNSQTQTIPGVKIDVSNVRGTTRFNDLHEELQKQIEQIDNLIQQQIMFKEQCDAIMPSHEQTLSYIPNDVTLLTSQVETVELALDNDSAAINNTKSIVQKDGDEAKISFRAIENLKLPSQFHYVGSLPTSSPSVKGITDSSSHGEGTDLVSYFSAAATEMSKTLELYRKNTAEIEAHLGTVESTTIAQSQQLMFTKSREGGVRSKGDQLQELEAVLREFEGGIFKVASNVGQLREEVQGVVLGEYSGRR